jgi:uncharacterized membrane protein YdjX (TVP38/TMEM64 family)
LWADRLHFNQAGAIAWLRDFGPWAWAAGIILLVSDLVLPVPGTAVMAALGYLYGPALGGLISAIGSFMSGAVAYGLCRITGRRGAAWLIGERDLQRGEDLFTRIGGWLVAVSRWLPLFPEVIACMAGLVRMPTRIFCLALLCGSVPLGFIYAAVGAAGKDNPTLALSLSAGLPPLLWLLLNRWIRQRVGAEKTAKNDSSSPGPPANL